MGSILKRIAKLFGWQKLLLWAWNIAYPDLKKLAASSEAQWDDQAVKFLNDFIVELTGAPKDVPKPEGYQD